MHFLPLLSYSLWILKNSCDSIHLHEWNWGQSALNDSNKTNSSFMSQGLVWPANHLSKIWTNLFRTHSLVHIKTKIWLNPVPVCNQTDCLWPQIFGPLLMFHLSNGEWEVTFTHQHITCNGKIELKIPLSNKFHKNTGVLCWIESQGVQRISAGCHFLMQSWNKSGYALL